MLFFSISHSFSTPFHFSVSFPLHVHMCVQSLSCVRLFATPWTVAHQAPLSMGFSRQEYWSGLPFSSPVHCSHIGSELASPALAGRFFTTAPLRKPKLRHTEEQFKIASCTDLHKYIIKLFLYYLHRLSKGLLIQQCLFLQDILLCLW